MSWRNLFGSAGRAKHGSQLESLSPAVSSAIFQTVGTRGIPPMPGAAQKAFQLAVDPTAEARDFVELIESDEALASRVLKIANSVFYDRGKKSTTVEECVIVIGLSELKNLLNANSLSEIFPSSHPARVQLWSNDIATALIARNLAQRLKPGSESTAFLGGLMHDIGKLLLLQRNTEDYVKVIRAVESTGRPFYEVEGETFPFDHTEVGQLVGERWRFSDELLGIIRRHHTVAPSAASLPGIVAAADRIAHALGLGHPPSFFRFQNRHQESLAKLWLELGIAEGEQRDLVQSLKRSFDLEYDLYAGSLGS